MLQVWISFKSQRIDIKLSTFGIFKAKALSFNNIYFYMSIRQKKLLKGLAIGALDIFVLINFQVKSFWLDYVKNSTDHPLCINPRGSFPIYWVEYWQNGWVSVKGKFL